MESGDSPRASVVRRSHLKKRESRSGPFAIAPLPSGAGAKSKPAETSKAFLSLVQSLGYQALMNLGEIPNPMTQQTELNPEGAKEAIDLLIALRDKTQGNLSDDEKKMIETLLTQLQIKFSQSV